MASSDRPSNVTNTVSLGAEAFEIRAFDDCCAKNHSGWGGFVPASDHIPAPMPMPMPTPIPRPTTAMTPAAIVPRVCDDFIVERVGLYSRPPIYIYRYIYICGFGLTTSPTSSLGPVAGRVGRLDSLLPKSQSFHVQVIIYHELRKYVERRPS